MVYIRSVTPDAPHPDIELIAAALRADTADLTAFTEVLADKLSSALPGRVEVERRRAGLRGPRRVRRLLVRLEDGELELVVDGAAPRASRALVSGGIVLKRESVDVTEWVRALSETLAGEAARSEAARHAIGELLA